MGGILLTSNGFFTEEIRTTFKRIAGTFSSAAIITTASLDKENNRFARKAQADLVQLGASEVAFIDIENDHSEQLLQFDVIYLNGGNPFLLLHHLRKSEADHLLKNSDKTIVGTSAGAIVLGPSIGVVQHFTPKMNTIPLNDLSGLNMTDISIFPHYDREDLFPHPTGVSIEERISQYERITGSRVHRLRDDEFLVTQKSEQI